MPRIIDGVERKTAEEIDNLAKEAVVEVKKVGRPRKVELQTIGIESLDSTVSNASSVGIFNANRAKQDASIEKNFPKLVADTDGWIEMTDEEAIRFQEQGILVGHNPIKGIGLLSRR